NSLDLLQAVYRSNDLPLHTRMRAAMAALKHEVPALAVQALITEQDIATVLDRRIANYERMKLLEAKPIAQPETNQHSPTNQQNIGETPMTCTGQRNQRHWHAYTTSACGAGFNASAAMMMVVVVLCLAGSKRQQ